MTAPLLVACLDSQQTFLDALAIALDTEDDLSVVGATSSIDETLELLDRVPVDVVVVDLAVPGVGGIEAARRIKGRRPATRVVVLATHAELDDVIRAAGAGADGFLSKDAALADIIDAVRHGDEGIRLDTGAITSLRERVVDPAPGRERWIPTLTTREREVLALLATGLDTQHIARQLGIGFHTCRGYIRSILVKLGAHSQLEAVAVARRTGLLREP